MNSLPFKKMSYGELLEVYDEVLEELHRAARQALGEVEYDEFRDGCFAQISRARSHADERMGRDANTLEGIAEKINARRKCDNCGAIGVGHDGICERCRTEDVA